MRYWMSSDAGRVGKALELEECSCLPLAAIVKEEDEPHLSVFTQHGLLVCNGIPAPPQFSTLLGVSWASVSQ